MTQQERNVLTKNLRGFTVGLGLTIVGCTATGVWVISEYYHGLLTAIQQSNSTNAVQDVRLGNVERRLDNDEASMRALSQNMGK